MLLKTDRASREEHVAASEILAELALDVPPRKHLGQRIGSELGTFVNQPQIRSQAHGLAQLGDERYGLRPHRILVHQQVDLRDTDGDRKINWLFHGDSPHRMHFLDKLSQRTDLRLNACPCLPGDLCRVEEERKPLTKQGAAAKLVLLCLSVDSELGQVACEVEHVHHSPAIAKRVVVIDVEC